MNTYVLIARHLGKVSGEKIYSYNKLEYMASHGWRVFFLSGKDEHDYIDSTALYSHYVFPALTYAPECYSRREINNTIDEIVTLIGAVENDQCIIESDSVNRALWAEMIAKRVGAKHIAFLLQETHPYDEAARMFLRFKYDRHELAGITQVSINQILADDSIDRRDDTRIAAFCNNAVKDCDDSISDSLAKDAKLTFGSLGRLDKGCVTAIINGFKMYAAAHADEVYNLVLIGGAMSKKRIRQIRKFLADCSNVHLTITGYMYPIPASLIQKIDLFVSTGGSANVTYRYHRPTVKVHPVTGAPVAVLGLDDMEGKTMYDVMTETTIEDCISRALSNTDKIQYTYNYYEDYFERMNKEFDRHISIANITKEKEYYDEELLMSIRTTHIKGHGLHVFIGHVLGAKGLNSFLNLSRKLLGN